MYTLFLHPFFVAVSLFEENVKTLKGFWHSQILQTGQTKSLSINTVHLLSAS